MIIKTPYQYALGIAVILGLGLGIWYYQNRIATNTEPFVNNSAVNQTATPTTPTTNPTVSLKVYSNRIVGYSFKYPNLDGDANAQSFPFDPRDYHGVYPQNCTLEVGIGISGYTRTNLDNYQYWIVNSTDYQKYLATCSTIAKDIVSIAHGGMEPDRYGGPDEEIALVVWQGVPLQTLFQNLHTDDGFAYNGQTDAPTVTRSNYSKTNLGLKYFTLTRTLHNETSDVLYVIELNPQLIAMIDTRNGITDFASSIINTITTI
jgi:hypothetical protein